MKKNSGTEFKINRIILSYSKLTPCGTYKTLPIFRGLGYFILLKPGQTFLYILLLDVFIKDQILA